MLNTFICLILLCALLTAGCQSSEPPILIPDKHQVSIPKLTPTISESDLKNWLYYLSSAALKGRSTGSPEEAQYGERIIEAFKAWGLEPGVSSSYIHRFKYLKNVSIGKHNTLSHNLSNLPNPQLYKDFVPYLFSKTGVVTAKSLVFAGYGIQAPAEEEFPRYNSYEKVDVKNKWVLLFDGLPEKAAGDLKNHLAAYSRIQHKVLVAERKGAVGVLIIAPPGSRLNSASLQPGSQQGQELNLPVLILSADFTERLLKEENISLKQLYAQQRSGSDTYSFDITQIQLSTQVDLNFEYATAQNIIGKIEKTNPKVKASGKDKAKSSIMIGAHGDHLGQGRAKAFNKIITYRGADDNASGMSVLLEAAHYFAQLKIEAPESIQQTLYFAIWSGEELGNLGSYQYLKEQAPQGLSAYVNLDMVGRLKGALTVQGVGSGDLWKETLNEVSVRTAVGFSYLKDPYAPTDSTSFYLRSIPSINFTTGTHFEYHTVNDLPELINFRGLQKVAEVLIETIKSLATTSWTPIKFKVQEEEVMTPELKPEDERLQRRIDRLINDF